MLLKQIILIFDNDIQAINLFFNTFKELILKLTMICQSKEQVIINIYKTTDINTGQK